MAGKPTHGHSTGGKLSPTYITWSQMKARCFNPKNPHYAEYGGRGVTVCEQWGRFKSFLEDMGVRVERACDISEEDALAEGMFYETSRPPTIEFQVLWESIYGREAWEKWCWVYDLKRVK